jgi:exodeoxyribonuclease V alpha subunit
LAALAPWVDAGVVGGTEVQVMATLANLAGPPGPGPEVLLGGALAVRAPLVGHVCVDLASVAGQLPGDPEAVTSDEPDSSAPNSSDLAWPEVDAWCEALSSSDLVTVATSVAPIPGLAGAGNNERAPLVLDGTRLYTERCWHDEQAIAAEFRRRATAGAVALPPADIDAVLDRLVGPPAGPDADGAQRDAIAAGLTRDLTVIAGGPGTGKTYTVATLLLALEQLGATTPDRIALAAPTGKAAARMTEAIAHAVASRGGDPDDTTAATGVAAVTVHRLLGANRHGHFYRNHAHPLDADVVIIDEASMVPAHLMARLLDALDDETRLVLVGDPGQLASVEAGTVLGDVVDAAATPGSPLAGSVITLERIHRFDTGTKLPDLADAIRAGATDEVIALLGSGAPGVTWVGEPLAQTAPVLIEVAGHARTLHGTATGGSTATSGDAASTLGQLGALSVLCAVKQGPGGVTHWNRWARHAAGAPGDPSPELPPPPDRWWDAADAAPLEAGQPVMATMNDYRTQVFNGDLGVLVPTPEGLRAAFGTSDAPRVVDPGRLSGLELAYATTIHKAQGSEFDHVVVVLPEESPILTRELLYTAVTRARSHVTVVATEAAVRIAVDTPGPRASGLAGYLSASG